jgi:hypothetical protein
MAIFVKSILRKKKFKHCRMVLGAGGFIMMVEKEEEEDEREESNVNDDPSNAEEQSSLAVCTLQFWKESKNTNENGEGNKENVNKEDVVELRLTEEEVVKVEEYFQIFHNAKDHMDNLEYERELEEEEKVERKWKKFNEEIGKVAMVEGEGEGDESQGQSQEQKE